jgi:hypothetical protein
MRRPGELGRGCVITSIRFCLEDIPVKTRCAPPGCLRPASRTISAGPPPRTGLRRASRSARRHPRAGRLPSGRNGPERGDALRASGREARGHRRHRKNRVFSRSNSASAARTPRPASGTDGRARLSGICLPRPIQQDFPIGRAAPAKFHARVKCRRRHGKARTVKFSGQCPGRRPSRCPIGSAASAPPSEKAHLRPLTHGVSHILRIPMRGGEGLCQRATKVHGQRSAARRHKFRPTPGAGAEGRIDLSARSR